jgi:predicted nucleotidyltransferase
MAKLNPLIARQAREALKVLKRQARVRAAYVFGSQASGTADKFSDIDIAAFIEGLELWDLRQRARIAVQVQKEAGDEVELHFLPAEALADHLPASLADYILRNGVRIEE